MRNFLNDQRYRRPIHKANGVNIDNGLGLSTQICLFLRCSENFTDI